MKWAEERTEMQAMQVDEALANADEWIKGVTLYEGARGWRVVCATLAAEVRRLRRLVMCGCGADATRYYEARANDLEAVARAMRDWIDAVPKDIQLPAMPGFDRDWADSIIDVSNVELTRLPERQSGGAKRNES